MKKFLSCLFLASVALCFCGCLDEHPKDQIDQEAIYNNADNIYNNAVASLYNYIGSNQESEGLQGTCQRHIRLQHPHDRRSHDSHSWRRLV